MLALMHYNPFAYLHSEKDVLKNTRGEYFWSHSVVSNILKNQSYVGNVINNPKENWTIHTDVHPAIVERELWEQVQNKFSNSKYREPKYTEKSIFAGFLKCADCGKNLNHKHLVEAPQNDYFSCGANRKSKSLCPQTHHIRIDYLTEGVRQALDRVVRFARDYTQRARVRTSSLKSLYRKSTSKFSCPKKRTKRSFKP